MRASPSAFVHSNLYRAVLGFLLSWTASLLVRRERWGSARWLLEASLWWNSCWTADPAFVYERLQTSPCGSDPIAYNLRQLAFVAAKMGNQRLLTRFAAALSARTFYSRKLSAARGWESFRQRVQNTARSLVARNAPTS